ncbi:MAG: HAD family phosphatase [Dehalococcoidia bacterium]|nr:HAD family phosphatase [Dehalococcoidia bacterium]
MRPKLIVIDLDGTLLNSQGSVSTRTASALKAAHEAGIVLAPATARWYQAAIRPFQAVGIAVAAIASAGADVRTADGVVVEQRPLDGDFALFLAALCDRAGWTATLSTPERAYRRANELPPWAAMAPEWLKPVTRFEGEHLQNALSVLAEAAPGDHHMPELEAWAGRVSLYPAVAFNGDALITITAPGVDKGSGLRALCAHLGIDPSEAAAIGDSEVDIPMFEVAGASIAMADGTPEARAAALTQTLAADEDGVAAYLESIL